VYKIGDKLDCKLLWYLLFERNNYEGYVSMSELNFPKRIIRLAAAKLKTVFCSVKNQNDCTEYFDTQQVLRQGDVLSTLNVNVVLESIVR
jgi:hypothetical protein